MMSTSIDLRHKIVGEWRKRTRRRSGGSKSGASAASRRASTTLMKSSSLAGRLVLNVVVHLNPGKEKVPIEVVPPVLGRDLILIRALTLGSKREAVARGNLKTLISMVETSRSPSTLHSMRHFMELKRQ
jgi:hypothetical protein